MQALSVGFSVSCLISLILFFLPFQSLLLFLIFQACLRVPIDFINLLISSSLSHCHWSHSFGKSQVCRTQWCAGLCLDRLSTVVQRTHDWQCIRCATPPEILLLLSRAYFKLLTFFSNLKFCQGLFTPSKCPSFLLLGKTIS